MFESQTETNILSLNFFLLLCSKGIIELLYHFKTTMFKSHLILLLVNIVLYYIVNWIVTPQFLCLHTFICVLFFSPWLSRYVPPDQARSVGSVQASVSGSSASSTGSTPEVQPLKSLQLNKTPLRQVPRQKTHRVVKKNIVALSQGQKRNWWRQSYRSNGMVLIQLKPAEQFKGGSQAS